MDKKIIKVFLEGGVVAMPTDTVYGLCARASDKNAVSKLYDLKKRENKPGTIIASSIDQLVDLGLKRRYLTAVEHFWPGVISVIVPSEPNLKYIDQGVGSVAMRIVADNRLRDILKKTGALLTTSANKPGEPTAKNIAEIKDIFGDRVDEYVDGGDLSGQKPSTIIRIVDDIVEVLREGAVKINEAGEVEK